MNETKNQYPNDPKTEYQDGPTKKDESPKELDKKTEAQTKPDEQARLRRLWRTLRATGRTILPWAQIAAAIATFIWYIGRMNGWW